LVEDQHGIALLGRARRDPGRLQFEQRHESLHFGNVSEQSAEHAREADRLLAQ